MVRGRKSKREHLIEAAQQLFYREGIKGTGIDAVLEYAGVSKRTLYNHFKSKDELVMATLKHRDEQFMLMLKAGVQKHQCRQTCVPAMAKVMAFFDAIEEWTQTNHFSGCMFINASAEYPRHEHPVHVICTMHKKLVIHYIEELTRDLNIKDSHALAEQLALVADGAIVNAHTASNPEAIKVAKHVARLLVDSHATADVAL